MRIAFLTPEYATSSKPDGGLANYLKKTAAALSDRGCDVWVFVRTGQDAFWQDGLVNICEVRTPESRWIDFLGRFRRLRPYGPAFRQLATAKALARRFWQEHALKPFDIIQAPSYTAAGYSLLNNGKVPVVCRISSYTPLVRQAYGRKKEPFETLTDRFEVRQVARADSSFAPSQLVARAFQQVVGQAPDVVRTPVDVAIPPLDVSYYNANRPEGRYLLFFGTLSRIKGVDLLAEALPPLLAKHPDLSCVLVGRDDGLPDGRKAYAHILERCIQFRRQLHYHPALVKPLLYPFVQHAEAILLPSRIDNYPNACLEAQMFGRPVIGTFESSLEEMVVEGETGFLAENDNASSLSAAIERCLSLSDAEKKAMKSRVLGHFDNVRNEDRVGQLLDYYEEAIGRHRRRRRRD